MRPREFLLATAAVAFFGSRLEISGQRPATNLKTTTEARHVQECTVLENNWLTCGARLAHPGVDHVFTVVLQDLGLEARRMRHSKVTTSATEQQRMRHSGDTIMHLIGHMCLPVCWFDVSLSVCKHSAYQNISCQCNRPEKQGGELGGQ